MAARSRGLELIIRPTVEFLYRFTFIAFQPDQMSTNAHGDLLALLTPRQFLLVRFACLMLFALKYIVQTVGRRSLGGCQGDRFGRCIATLRW